MFPTLYYFFVAYIGFKVVNVVKPLIVPLTYFAINNLTVKKTSITKFDTNTITPNSCISLFTRQLNFAKLYLVDYYDTTGIVLGNYSYKVQDQETIETNSDYVIIKCDKHILFKQAVYHKLFEISGMDKLVFNDVYDKNMYLIIDVKDGACYYLD